MEKTKGVTLLGLIVTIIVLIILAMITINLTINGGIFEYAQRAKKQNKISQITEYLDLKVVDAKTQYFMQSNQVIIEKAREKVIDNQEELKKFGEQISIKEVLQEEQEVYFYVIIDKEIYKVSLDGTQYIGEQTEDEVQLQEKDIEFTSSPTTWTNGNVKIQIMANRNIDGYNIEYQIDRSNIWNTYEGEVEVDKNQIIYARLAGIKGQTSKVPFEISNIDKLLPKEIEVETVITDNSIQIIAKTEDNEATNEYEKSGIFGYRFKIDSGEWSDYQESGTYTFSELQQNVPYEIEIEVKDNAGNINTKKITVEIESLVISDFTPTIINENGTYFTIDASSALTTDGSSIVEYTYIINGKIHGTTQENQYLATGLDLSSNYTVQVIATDINGKDKKSESVECTTNGKQYIYKSGNEYTELTGGWKNSSLTGGATGSKEKDNIYIYCPNKVNVYTTYVFSTEKKIDISKFNTLNAILSVSSASGKQRWAEIGMFDGSYHASTKQAINVFNIIHFKDNITKKEVSIEITDKTSGYGYIQALAGGNGSDIIKMNVYEVWFE